jgi:hypothetical protein
MNIKNFNEALYASSNGVVVERRKSIIVPALVLLAGVALLVANSFIENGNDTNNLKSALILVGGAIALVSFALCAVRIFGAGEPYHTADKCFLIRKHYSFEREQRDSVVKAVEACDKTALDNIEENDIAGISVVCYHSPRSKYCAMQAFAYEELLYKSITELKRRN